MSKQPLDELAELWSRFRLQADHVREMKANKAPKDEVAEAVVELKARKKAAETMQKEIVPEDAKVDFHRPGVEDVCKQRFFYAPAFSLYGGQAGLYDFGPNGCAVKNKIIDLWRKRFITDERGDILELDCTTLTPQTVFKASGHVEKFTDVMVEDKVEKTFIRADHLLEDFLEKALTDYSISAELRAEYQKNLDMIEGYELKDLDRLIKKYGVKSYLGNPVGDAREFNLMFPTQIGAEEGNKGFFRPETAQGMFLNYLRLYAQAGQKLPFGGAQIGLAYRNEISPRNGLLRVREFTLAEIEYFVDPADKSHKRFHLLSQVELPLLTKDAQESGRREPTLMTAREAVEKGIISCETLGYFVAKIYKFLLEVGLDSRYIRFRQHLETEMAHYACDCWDAEALTSYGWIEIVGCADRSCHDLTSHAKATKTNLQAEEKIDPPLIVEEVKMVPNKGLFGKAFKKDAKQITEYLEACSEKDLLDLKAKLEGPEGQIAVRLNGAEFVVTAKMLTIKKETVKKTVRRFTPSVVEPAFGLGRILYTLLEHSYDLRDANDEQRSLFKFPYNLAPVDCAILPMSQQNKAAFAEKTELIAQDVTEHGLSFKIDASSAAIGRRYARADEIGTSFSITCDFQTLDDDTVTVRERDSMLQVRVPRVSVAAVVADMVKLKVTWEETQKQYPAFSA